jgi:PAS domain S-box-containing protein
VTWLKAQGQGVLEDWIRHTKAPMLATMPDGKILWVNSSFEDLLGWTSVELIGKLTWMELTDDKEELQADIDLVAEIVAGDRNNYQLQKPYKKKNGAPVRVVIDVVRYPQNGEFECFLVTVFPVDRGVEFAMGQLSEIRKMLLTLISQEPTGLTFAKVSTFSKERPIVAAIVATLLGVLLFGERVYEIVKLFLK